MVQNNNDKELTSFDSLPNEIITMLLLYLTLDDLKNISMVNKRFFSFLQDSIVIASWLSHQSTVPFVNVLSDGVEIPFFPSWLLRLAVRGKIISYSSPITAVLPMPMERQLTLPVGDDQITVGNCNKMLLLWDYFYAAKNFWQQLTQAQLALLTIYDVSPDSWVSRLSFMNTDILSLLLLHQFPHWRIQDWQDKEELIVKRQAFINSLIDIGFLPNYSKKTERKKLADKDLVLFPFSPLQNGVDWHHAMQWLYQQEELAEIRLSLSDAITSHFQALLKQGDKGRWASAYLAAKFMTVCMSHPHEFTYAIDYLILTIEWLTALLPSPLFTDYATGVGQLVFEMLVGFNNSKWFQPDLFREFRHDYLTQVSRPITATLEIRMFILNNPPPKGKKLKCTRLTLLKSVMEQGQTLFKTLKPHVTLNSYIKKALEEEEKMDALLIEADDDYFGFGL